MKSLASLGQITVFVRVAELGSLTAAAKELNITPSAVSKSLAQLEAHLGMLLIKRTTRSLKLTEQGRIIVERASAILADVEMTLDAARQLSKPEGVLHLTSSIAFGSCRLADLISRYLVRYPKVDVRVSLEERIVNLAEEEIDVALRITAGTQWNLPARRLAPIRWVYCAAPSYLDEHGCINDPRDIAGRDCLVYPAMTQNGGWAFENGRSHLTVKVRARMACNSSMALRHAAIQGAGIACLPTYVVSEDILAGRLSMVAPEYRCTIAHTLYAMYFRSKYINPVIRSFIDFLVESLDQVPPWDVVLMERYPSLVPRSAS